MTGTIRRMISFLVMSIASLAIIMALGCSFNFFKHDVNPRVCEGSTEKAYAVLTGLMTTLIGLAVKLDSFEDHPEGAQPKPKPKPSSRPRPPVSKASKKENSANPDNPGTLRQR